MVASFTRWSVLTFVSASPARVQKSIDSPPPTLRSSHAQGVPGGSVAILRCMKTFFFVLRVTLAWGALIVLVLILWSVISPRNGPPDIFGLLAAVLLLVVAVRAFSHVRRVRLIAPQVDSSTLA